MKKVILETEPATPVVLLDSVNLVESIFVLVRAGLAPMVLVGARDGVLNTWRPVYQALCANPTPAAIAPGMGFATGSAYTLVEAELKRGNQVLVFDYLADFLSWYIDNDASAVIRSLMDKVVTPGGAPTDLDEAPWPT